MSVKKQEVRLGDALKKVALGYQLAEVTEEYAEVDGELKLMKRKKTKKDIPPDLKAVQMLLAADGRADYGGWSDEELEAERRRLLAELKTEEDICPAAQSTKTAEKGKVEKTEKTAEGVVCGEGQASKPKKTRPKPRKRVVRKK